MQIVIPLIYDLAAVILILLTVSYSAQKGFTATVVGLVGHVTAFFGSMFIAKAASQIIYTTTIKGRLITLLEDKLVNSGGISDLFSQLDKILSELPTLVSNIVGSAGFDQQALTSAVGSSVNEAVLALEKTVIAPAITGFITAVLFAVLFFVFSIVVRAITKTLSMVAKTTILRPVDRLFGGVLGVLQSGIYLYIICIGARLFISALGGMKYLNQDLIMQTFIWSRVYVFDPFAFL